jgi:hypothetical protein
MTFENRLCVPTVRSSFELWRDFDAFSPIISVSKPDATKSEYNRLAISPTPNSAFACASTDQALFLAVTLVGQHPRECLLKRDVPGLTDVIPQF